jgi:hypothetical protein
MSTSVTTSKKFTLNLNDFWKGLLLAVITAAMTIIVPIIQSGSLTFDWAAIGRNALLAGLAYLVKNWFTPSQIVVKDAPEAIVKKVKEGEAEIQVVNK